MSATQVQAIREAAAGDFYAAWEPGFTRHVVTTLLAALDAAQAENAALWAALVDERLNYTTSAGIMTDAQLAEARREIRAQLAWELAP